MTLYTNGLEKSCANSEAGVTVALSDISNTGIRLVLFNEEGIVSVIVFEYSLIVPIISGLVSAILKDLITFSELTSSNSLSSQETKNVTRAIRTNLTQQLIFPIFLRLILYKKRN